MSARRAGAALGIAPRSLRRGCGAVGAGRAASCAPGARRLACLALALAPACRGVADFSGEQGPVQPTRGAVVSEHPLATEVALDVLARGGNAADAAVACALALAVVYPQAGNLGGGGFALWVPHGGAPEAIDFRELAPAGARAEAYLDPRGELVPERSLETALAVGVPGTPAGLYALWQRHRSGSFSWAELCAPAILLAAEGFPVDPWLAADLADEEARARLARDPGARALFFPSGEPLRAGQRLVQPELAATLRQLARGGPPAFYRGEVAEAIVATLAAADARAGGLAAGGHVTLADLEAYEPVVRRPLVGWFRGYEVVCMPPPSSGGLVLLQVLGMLDGFPLESQRRHALDAGLEDGVDARAAHWWIEALRRAFADRAVHMGDPDHWPVPVEALLDPEWIARRRVGIGNRARLEVGAMPAPAGEGGQTTHLSVLDRQGNAVSLTTTLNDSFGSGILVPTAGFLLNNEIDDFSIRPGAPNLYGLVGGEANELAPGKRPLSSMSPTVVREDGGRVVLVLGSPGGPRIITSVLQVLLRLAVYEQSLEQAVRAPRLHQQWQPPATRFEAGFDPRLLETLAEVHGHPTSVEPAARFGSVQAIRVAADGEPTAVSDPRRGGAAGVEGRPPSLPAHPADPVQPVLEDAARIGRRGR